MRISSLDSWRSSCRGDPRLLELAGRCLLGGLEPLGLARRVDVEHVVLDVLLGDRRGTLDDVTGRRVRDDRAQRALPVDAVVLVEPAVLDGQHRALHRGRDLVVRDLGAVLVEQVGDRATVGVGERRRQRRAGADQVRRARRDAVTRLVGQHAEAADQREGHARRDHTEQDAQAGEDAERAEQTPGNLTGPAYGPRRQEPVRPTPRVA